MENTIVRKDAEISNIKTELAGIKASQSSQIEALTDQLEAKTKEVSELTAKLEAQEAKVGVPVNVRRAKWAPPLIGCVCGLFLWAACAGWQAAKDLKSVQDKLDKWKKKLKDARAARASDQMTIADLKAAAAKQKENDEAGKAVVRSRLCSRTQYYSCSPRVLTCADAFRLRPQLLRRQAKRPWRRRSSRARGS